MQSSDLYLSPPLPLRPSLPRFQGSQGLNPRGSLEFNPCEVEGHLQLEITKFSLKKEKGRKNLLELGNCRVSFSLEDWLVISFREGGFLTQQMEAGQPDH